MWNCFCCCFHWFDDSTAFDLACIEELKLNLHIVHRINGLKKKRRKKTSILLSSDGTYQLCNCNYAMCKQQSNYYVEFPASFHN